MRFYECEVCGKAPLNENEIFRYPNNAIFYCKECVSELFMVCSCCDEIYLLTEMKHEGGEFYCLECYEESFERCEGCGLVAPHDDGEIFYYESYDGCLCHNCYSENLFYCESCEQDIMFNMEGGAQEINGNWVCSSCYAEIQVESKGVLFILKEFIKFEQDNPFPERTLRRWILYLLDGRFKCPCILAYHQCRISLCPRGLSSCKANDIYQFIQNSERKFVRFYLLRKLLEIYSKVDNNDFLDSIGYKDLLALLKGYVRLNIKF